VIVRRSRSPPPRDSARPPSSPFWQARQMGLDHRPSRPIWDAGLNRYLEIIRSRVRCPF